MKSTRVFTIVVALALLLSTGLGISQAQGPAPQGSGLTGDVSGGFTYQGQLNKGGNPVNDTCDMRFKLFDAASSGSQVGSTLTIPGVSVSGGLFTVPGLDFGGYFNGQALWLEVGVKCSGDAAYVALTPLQELTPAPYALSLKPGALIYGNVATGLSVAAAGTGVNGQGGTYGVLGHTVATSGYSVGVRGESISTAGWGVHGVASATSGVTYGVGGVSSSNAGIGVIGSADASTGTTYGVYGAVQSPDGRGIYGTSTSTTGVPYGVYGEVSAPMGRGVYGVNHATTSTTEGVYGAAYSPDGRGVLAINYAITSTAYGVFGRSDSTDGVGVYGLANDATCEWAIANGEPCGGIVGQSDNGFGVWGHSLDGTALGAYTGEGTALYLFSPYAAGGDFIHATVGVMSPDTKFRVTRTGEVYADGTFHTPAADMAELLPAAAGLEPGDVLVIGPDGRLARSTQAYQPTVVGVYSTKPALLGGSTDEANAGKVPLAVVGVVPVKVSAENGAIRPGDLLVASGTAGHAMRAGANPAVGSVIGKALAGLDKGTGVILMLVVLQ